MKIYSDVGENGVLPIKISLNIKKELKLLSNKSVSITIDALSKNRSNLQNAYYWGVIIYDIRNAINELGNNVSSDQVHQFLRTSLGLSDSICINDTYVDICRSTTKYSTKEFDDYLEKCRAWGADFLNIEINLPNEF